MDVCHWQACFLCPLRAAPPSVLSPDLHAKLFGHIEELIAAHRSLLEALDTSEERWLELSELVP